MQAAGESEAAVTLTDSSTFNVRRGRRDLEIEDPHYIQTGHHERLLADLITSHRYHDMCIVGPRVNSMVFSSHTSGIFTHAARRHTLQIGWLFLTCAARWF